ncbi:MAG: hypothetical protein IIA14_00565, partial [SAR324 cluster bacterium]|nr:hypothetical protein [SAR324 cluster bacterium]
MKQPAFANASLAHHRNDLTFTGGSPFAYAQLGHGAAFGSSTGMRTGNIRVIVGGSATLQGGLQGAIITSPALLGHATTTPSVITGDLVLAIDQADPLVDNGGRLFLNQRSLIDMG